MALRAHDKSNTDTHQRTGRHHINHALSLRLERSGKVAGGPEQEHGEVERARGLDRNEKWGGRRPMFTSASLPFARTHAHQRTSRISPLTKLLCQTSFLLHVHGGTKLGVTHTHTHTRKDRGEKMPSPRPQPPLVSSILTPILTPHATASVAVLALAVALREQVMSSGAPSAATMANWEPLALCAAAGSVAARVISRGAGLAGALPIAARVAQLTACSLLFTASPAAGAWLVAAAGAAAALVPWSSAEEEATFGALPATTPAAVTETVGGPDKLVLVLYDPAGGSRTNAAVAALAAYAARVKGGSVRTDGGRGGGGRPPTFARLDAARWPEVVGALAGYEEPVALPVVVVWEGGKVVRRVGGRGVPTSEGRWESTLM